MYTPAMSPPEQGITRRFFLFAREMIGFSVARQSGALAPVVDEGRYDGKQARTATALKSPITGIRNSACSSFAPTHTHVLPYFVPSRHAWLAFSSPSTWISSGPRPPRHMSKRNRQRSGGVPQTFIKYMGRSPPLSPSPSPLLPLHPFDDQLIPLKNLFFLPPPVCWGTRLCTLTLSDPSSTSLPISVEQASNVGVL